MDGGGNDNMFNINMNHVIGQRFSSRDNIGVIEKSFTGINNVSLTRSSFIRYPSSK